MLRSALALDACALATPAAALAADSVVLGHGVSNAFHTSSPCPPDCMGAEYIWVLDAHRTVSGPKVTGRIRAITFQHTDATSQYVKSVELFVLRPIEDASIRKSSGADYYLVSLSPRDSRGRYCLNMKPSELDLTVAASEVTVDASSGYYCFKASALASNNRWRGP